MTATSPSPTPSPVATPRIDLSKVLVTEYRLIVRSVCTPGRLIAAGMLAVVSVLTAVGVAADTPAHPLHAGVRFVNGNVATLIPVAVLLFGAASIGDLMDDGSLVYLWLRPIPTWVHVAAAWAATCTVVIPILLVPMTAATAIIDHSPTLMGPALLAGLVAVMVYAALFVMLGIRFRRALPWGLAYILIWEGFVASAGKTATKLAIRSYIRSILSAQTGVELKLGEFSLAVGVTVPLLVGVAALAYATRRLARTDVA